MLRNLFTKLCGQIMSIILPASVLAAPTSQWSKIDIDNGFEGWNKELHQVVQRDAHHVNNTFCLVVDHGTRDHVAYVYWPQESKLLSWGASENEVSELDQAAAPLDLTRDVVASQGKIGTSTYLVTRAWVDGIISACRKFGTNVNIKKS